MKNTKYKVFADTNVFLDHLLQRTSDWQFAEAVFKLADQKEITLFASSSCLVNVIYILQKQAFQLPTLFSCARMFYPT